MIPGGFSAQILAYAGFDWLCVDMQHGVIGYTLFGLPSDSLLLRRAVDWLVQSLGPR